MVEGVSHLNVAIIGGGIIGLATAMTLATATDPAPSIIVLEAEDHLAAHQSSHNTGVIHSGVFYRPGTLKARLCVEGREALYRFCREHGLAHERCGKVIVASREADLPGLEELERRGRANGLAGLRRLNPAEIRDFEPHAVGVAGLYVSEAGVVDYAEVSRAFADRFRAAGGSIRTAARVEACDRQSEGLTLLTTAGEVRCRVAINCAGLQADRVARLCGVDPGVRIVPFRGQYYELVPGRQGLVRHLIYPVPDLSLPFLGEHLTRNVRGVVEAAPNGALVLDRHGYRSALSICRRDAWEMLTNSGFWLLALRRFGTGAIEACHALSRHAFVAALRPMVPELRPEDLRRARAGIHAQAVRPDGSLVEDFQILEAGPTVHVLNTTSPAATASIALGRAVAAAAARQPGLTPLPAPAVDALGGGPIG
ncbi:MAG: L-2-hydroxyglutarate oxidase [Isosphaeraceae bacterium]|nr:L-2-hydroxyglutarate oxidase [Isosphaeraceae bacterium]